MSASTFLNHTHVGDDRNSGPEKLSCSLPTSLTMKPVFQRDHCHERPPLLTDHVFLAEGLTFQYHWTCHQRPPVLVDGFQHRFYCIIQHRFYCIVHARTMIVSFIHVHVIYNIVSSPTLQGWSSVYELGRSRQSYIGLLWLTTAGQCLIPVLVGGFLQPASNQPLWLAVSPRPALVPQQPLSPLSAGESEIRRHGDHCYRGLQSLLVATEVGDSKRGVTESVVGDRQAGLGPGSRTQVRTSCWVINKLWKIFILKRFYMWEQIYLC